MEILVEKLNERIKELRCIYQVEELLADPGQDLEPVFLRLLDIISTGWQHTTICEACITYEDKEYVRPDFVRTPGSRKPTWWWTIPWWGTSGFIISRK